MTSVGYARVSSIGQELDVQIDKLAMCERVFKEKQSAVDTDRPELRRCLDYLRDTLLVTKIDRLARSTSDLYRIVSAFGPKLALTPERIAEIKALRLGGSTVPNIMRHMGLSKASVDHTEDGFFSAR